MNAGYRLVWRVVLVVALVMLCLTGWSQLGHAQATGIDPQAEKILRRMTDYLGGLKKFSLQTQVTLEDLLDSDRKSVV